MRDLSDRPIAACHYPWSWLHVCSDGSVKPCCHARSTVGSLAVQDVEEVWNGPVMRQLRASIRDGFVHPVCRGAACTFVPETERKLGLAAYDLRCDLPGHVCFRDSDSRRHLLEGWSLPEPWGVWSMGSTARMAFTFIPSPKQALKMYAHVAGYCTEDHSSTDVAVEVNGHTLGRWHFTVRRGSGRQVVVIPAAIATQEPRLDVTFHIKNPKAPRALGLSSDGRKLGLAISNLWFRETRWPSSWSLPFLTLAQALRWRYRAQPVRWAS